MNGEMNVWDFVNSEKSKQEIVTTRILEPVFCQLTWILAHWHLIRLFGPRIYKI